MVRYLFVLIALVNFVSAKLSLEVNTTINVPYWEVTKGNKRFYLFGTMHLKDKRVVVLEEKIKDLISQVDAVYTEIPLDPLTKMAITKYMVSKTPLSQILPTKLQNEIDSYLKSINPILSIKSFDSMKVWVFAAMLPTLKSQIYHKNIKSLDEFIFNEAFKKHKKVGGIETIKEQIDIFDNLPLNEQIALLEETLNELKDNSTYKEMIDSYFKGDTNTLYKLTMQMYRSSKIKNKERLFDNLLYNRNKRMAKRIEQMVQNSNRVYLFAFGAMHFLGDRSVIDYLKKDGFKITKKSLKDIK